LSNITELLSVVLCRVIRKETHNASKVAANSLARSASLRDGLRREEREFVHIFHGLKRPFSTVFSQFSLDKKANKW
jgi:hypothetical protein